MSLSHEVDSPQVSRGETIDQPNGISFSILINPDQKLLLSDMMNHEWKTRFDRIKFYFNQKEIGDTDHSYEWRDLLREWSPDRVRKVAKGLCGILGEYSYGSHSVLVRNASGGNIVPVEVRDGYFISEENVDAVREALNTGVFTKQVTGEDIAILQAVYNRWKLLRESYGKNWSPDFHQTEIERLAGLEKGKAEASLLRLSGILAQKYIRSRVTHGGTRIKWAISPSRVLEIESLLALVL